MGNLSLAVAFVAGLASFLSPCVVPLVPSYLSALAGTTVVGAGSDTTVLRGRVVRNALAFMAGLVVILVIAGLLATSFGQFVSSHQKLLAELGGIVIVVFGLNLLGVIHIGLFERQVGFQARPRRGFVGAFLMGLVFAAGWTPCIGPIAGSILLLASNAHSVATGGILLLVYALGLSLPFLVMALVLDRLMPILHGLGRYLPLITRAAGLLLVLLGAALVTGWYSRIPGLL